MNKSKVVSQIVEQLYTVIPPEVEQMTRDQIYNYIASCIFDNVIEPNLDAMFKDSVVLKRCIMSEPKQVNSLFGEQWEIILSKVTDASIVRKDISIVGATQEEVQTAAELYLKNIQESN